MKKKKQKATDKCRRLLQRPQQRCLSAFRIFQLEYHRCESSICGSHSDATAPLPRPTPPRPTRTLHIQKHSHNCVPKRVFTTKSVSPSTSSYYVAVVKTANRCCEMSGKQTIRVSEAPRPPHPNLLKSFRGDTMICIFRDDQGRVVSA